jgi:hypothetical protein
MNTKMNRFQMCVDNFQSLQALTEVDMQASETEWIGRGKHRVRTVTLLLPVTPGADVLTLAGWVMLTASVFSPIITCRLGLKLDLESPFQGI